MVLGIGTAQAQYEPNTKWPYIYETFLPGAIIFEGNQKTQAELNIHLAGNVLHYVDSRGRIMQSDERNVIRVEIGEDAYLYNGHRLMKIVANNGTNVLLRLLRADFAAMQNSGGAYGASLNSSASSDLSSLDLGGLDQPEMGKMLQEKDEGRTIPLVENYYFIIDGKEIDANKKAVERLIGSERAAEWKKFQKENKVKWKKEESLKQVLDFISKQ